MRRILKSGAGSAAVHAAAIGGFLLIDLGAQNQPITIDLTIMAAETMPFDAESSAANGADSSSPEPPAPSRPRARPVRRTEKTTSLARVDVSRGPPRNVEEPKSFPESPATDGQGDESQKQQSGPASGSAAAAVPPAAVLGASPGAGANPPGAAAPGVGAQQAYLAAHFAYIREAIQRSATYPPLARRMGWAGRVVLAFRILADGTVANVRVTKGAGFPVLDSGAIEAVRRAAPFPRPPVEAEIVVPVAYALE